MDECVLHQCAAPGPCDNAGECLRAKLKVKAQEHAERYDSGIPLLEAVRGLKAAVENKGHVPEYHDEIMARHRQEWPSLWRWIDRVIAIPKHYP